MFVILYSSTVNTTDGPMMETSTEAAQLGADIAALLSDVFNWPADHTEFLHARARSQRTGGTWYGIERALATGDRKTPA